jgi:hypothetical protein
VRRIGLTLGATVVAAAALAWALRTLDPQAVGFAFVIVWLPMTWLGTVSRVVPPRLPASWHRLRPFEQDGRLYELLGVKLFKRLLRRGPMAAFNPGLHLPAEPTPERIGQLDHRMRIAEASHLLVFVAAVAVTLHAVARGWWGAAAWTTLFNVALNGYPVMLQRYNRTLLEQRFGPLPAPGSIRPSGRTRP